MAFSQPRNGVEIDPNDLLIILSIKLFLYRCSHNLFLASQLLAGLCVQNLHQALAICTWYNHTRSDDKIGYSSLLYDASGYYILDA